MKLNTHFNHSTEYTWDNKYKSGEIYILKDIFEPYCCECMEYAKNYEIFEYSERQGNVGSKMSITGNESEEVLKKMWTALYEQRYWFLIPLRKS